MENPSLLPELGKSVSDSKVFVVGAGGIGCELLKNLVLTGFRNIKVIDLDTIDVSNLNRQFLFQKKHVGCSKANVAKESVMRLCPSANITAIHDSIFNPEYNMQYFKQFDLVMNALDNRSARNHVNRMCLAANVPLIESGSAGYLGQVTAIKRGVTECYECTPAPRQKTFPGCTIRNTPSEPIHCIVWAKYLFNQLFGEEDADQDVSPDTEDPEATTGEPTEAKSNKLGNIERKSTREWAKENDYNPEKIFNKLFANDIKYLLSMDKLWKKRKPPKPIEWANVEPGSSATLGQGDHQTVLSLKENAALFAESIQKLNVRLNNEGDKGMLVWDKDDLPALNFAASAANIRAHIFGIENKSVFEVKSMAGNIIPAIATTNAIVAGLIVMQALCIIGNQFDRCRSVFVRKCVNPAKKLLVPCCLDPPKPDCYVCTEKPEITVALNIEAFSVGEFRDQFLKDNLGMLAPDVEVLDGKGTILFSSEEDEEDTIDFTRPLADFDLISGSRLRADDFLQNYDIRINLIHETDLDKDEAFKVLSRTGNIDNTEDFASGNNAENNDGGDDDVVIETSVTTDRKRKLSDATQNLTDNESNTKRRRVSTIDDVVMIE